MHLADKSIDQYFPKPSNSPEGEILRSRLDHYSIYEESQFYQFRLFQDPNEPEICINMIRFITYHKLRVEAVKIVGSKRDIFN